MDRVEIELPVLAVLDLTLFVVAEEHETASDMAKDEQDELADVEQEENLEIGSKLSVISDDEACTW